MSLISQNVIPISPIDKTNRFHIKKPSESDRNEVPEDRGESDHDVHEKRKRKKKPKNEDKQFGLEQEKDMKKLENFLFGSLHAPLKFGKGDEEVQDVPGKDSALFFTDRSASAAPTIYEEGAEICQNDEEEESEARKPVWIDEEEEKIEVNISNVHRLRKLKEHEDETMVSGSVYVSRLRAQYAKLNPGTEWAWPEKQPRGQNDSSDDESDVEAENMEAILRTNEDLVVKGTTKLLPGPLEYSKLVNANTEEPASGPINSVEFHRNAQLLLTAGLDRRVRFFQVDGKRNTKIESIFLEKCPVWKASFLPDGSQVIISGRRKFFYCFDLVKAVIEKAGPLVGREEKSLESFEVSPDSKTIAFIGNEGYILLVSAKTKELIGTMKMNGAVRALAFGDYGQRLLSSGSDGQIYHWDLRTRSCLHKGVDEGCINGTALCASPHGSLFAAGSASGIVNVYDQNEFLGGKSKPMKVIENLTTIVDFMKFSNDAQILAVGSTQQKSGLKLVHVPSFTVFSNWPGPKQSLRRPRTVDFSPGGGFMAVGNAAGNVLLYKLHHYQQA